VRAVVETHVEQPRFRPQPDLDWLWSVQRI
jgi:hypothetical protein